MTKQQIHEKAKGLQLLHETAAQVREILDAAAEKFSVEAFPDTDFDEAALELVTEES